MLLQPALSPARDRRPIVLLNHVVRLEPLIQLLRRLQPGIAHDGRRTVAVGRKHFGQRRKFLVQHSQDAGSVFVGGILNRVNLKRDRYYYSQYYRPEYYLASVASPDARLPGTSL